MQIEPDAKIVQGHFCSQASLKSGQVMRMFPSQTERVQQLVIDGFNDLPQSGQPAPQGFGPVKPFAALMGWGDQIDLILFAPPTPGPLTSKPFIGHIRPLSWQTGTGQAWRRGLTSSKQRGSQVLIVRACASKAKAGNDSLSRDAQQQMEPFVPADAITPADIRLTRQPALAASLRIASHRSRAVEHLIGSLLRLQKLHRKQGKGGDRISLASQQPIELAAIRQLRKRFLQVMLCIAIKCSFTGKLHPLAKQCQRDHLTSAELRLWSGFGPLWLKLPLAKIINHNVQCSQECVQIDHQRAPFLTNRVLYAHSTTWISSFQALSNSHQTFKKGKYIGYIATKPDGQVFLAKEKVHDGYIYTIYFTLSFVGVVSRWKSGAGKDAVELVAEHRDVTRVRVVGSGGVEAEEAPFTHDVPIGFEAFDANVVQVGGPMHRGTRIGLRQVKEAS